MRTRILIFATIYLAFCTLLPPAQANVFLSPPLYQQYTYIYFTKDDYFASLEEGLLDKAVKIALSDGYKGLSKFISEDDFIFFLREGLMVRLIKPSYPGKVLILLIDYGIYVWTLKEAIE